MDLILAADIGGTNARFALFEIQGAELRLRDSVSLSTTHASCFADIVVALGDSALGPWVSKARVSSLGIAGPVSADGFYCNPPNISWDVDLTEPGLGLSNARLCNDFTAQAHAVLTPVMDGALSVLPGEIDPSRRVAVIGAGTGLGKAVLVPDGHGEWIVVPSEGGHALFPFEGEEEFRLQRFFQTRTGCEQIIGNAVVSGSGLATIHAFLTGQDLEPAQAAQAMAESEQTVQWMARFYGRVCRDYALEVLPVGGVVIAGGVAAKNPGLVGHEAFRAEFMRSAAHSRLLGGLPVRLNGNEQAGLWGAARLGMQHLCNS